jgi:hypothetical protein
MTVLDAMRGVYSEVDRALDPSRLLMFTSASGMLVARALCGMGSFMCSWRISKPGLGRFEAELLRLLSGYQEASERWQIPFTLTPLGCR